MSARALATTIALAFALAAPGRAQAAVDAEALQRLYDYAFTRTGADADKKGIRTDGLVILKDGELVAERYHEAGGFTAATPHIGWSVSKSALATLVGIAVREGRLALDAPLSTYLPELAAVGAAGPKLRDALEMSSCMLWSETYEGGDLTTSSVIAMLYGSGREAMASFVATRALDCTPGKTWEYKSGDSMLVAAALRKAYGAEYDELPWRALFDKLGMSSAVWERDAAGDFIGSSYLYATPRDFAKLGQLYLADGVWQGERILPEGWTAYVGKPATAFHTTDVPSDGSAWVGGAHWWSNAPVPDKGLPSTWPSAPADMLVASGHWGQSIYVIPSLGIVIARTADDRDGSLDEDKLLALALAAVAPGAHPAATTVRTAAPAAAAAATAPGVGKTTQRETPYIDLPGLSAAFVAKEMCSCLFVSGRSEEQCGVYASQAPMFASYALDLDGRAVRAALRFASIGGRGLYQRKATWRGARFGCTLD